MNKADLRTANFKNPVKSSPRHHQTPDPKISPSPPGHSAWSPCITVSQEVLHFTVRPCASPIIPCASVCSSLKWANSFIPGIWDAPELNPWFGNASPLTGYICTTGGGRSERSVPRLQLWRFQVRRSRVEPGDIFHPLPQSF